MRGKTLVGVKSPILGVFFILIASFLALLPEKAFAATINVAHWLEPASIDPTSGFNGTSCSLREAIIAANTNATPGGSNCTPGDVGGVDTIILPPNHGNNMHLAADLPTITSDIAIVAPSNKILSIQGDGLYAIFLVNGGASLAIATAGSNAFALFDSPRPIAILGDGATVDIDNVIFAKNHVGGAGGAIASIASTADLNISNSTFRFNTAAGPGGAIYFQGGNVAIENSVFHDNSTDNAGGAFAGSGTWNVLNSTISGNKAAADGGAVYGLDAGASFNFRNSTVTNNISDSNMDGAGGGGGLYNNGGSFNIANTILAGNYDRSGETTPGVEAPDCAGNLNSGGFNIVGDDMNCNFTAAASDQFGEAHLAPLANNGGSTKSHALLPNSPAIDGGNSAGCEDFASNPLTTDQRGLPRPIDALAGPICDIGAFESNRALVVNSLADDADASPGDGVCQTSLGECTLRAAMSEAETTNVADTIVFANGLSGTISPATPLPRPVDSLIIFGPGANQLTIDGSLHATSSLAIIHTGLGFTERGLYLHGMRLIGGAKRAVFASGGSVSSTNPTYANGLTTFSRLSLDEMEITAKDAQTISGGVYATGLYLDVSQSTFADLDSYGIRANGVITKINDSTFANNFADIPFSDAFYRQYGGGLYLEGVGETYVSNTTFSGNSAAVNGGAIFFSKVVDSTGNGVEGNLYLSHVTFKNNAAVEGGAIHFFSDAFPAYIRNSVFEGNSPTTCGAEPTSTVNVVSQDFNVSDQNTCGFGVDDLVNQQDILDVLAFNGGPTPTHALLPQSPALDLVPVLDCVDADGRPLSADQRGAVRPFNGLCDAGSYEEGPVEAVCGNGFVEIGEDCDDGNSIDGDCCSNDCVAASDGMTCDDGNLCTTGETCQAGACEAGQAVDCDDGNACTTDSCDPQSGSCDNVPLDCDDGNLCTDDACNPVSGVCENIAVDCSDGNACTSDSCDPGTGCNNPPIVCNDLDECTSDSCDTLAGCQFTPLPDGDSDTVCDVLDNCPDDPNPGQEDADQDGIGDVCEEAQEGPITFQIAVPQGSDMTQSTGGIDYNLSPHGGWPAISGIPICGENDGLYCWNSFDLDYNDRVYQFILSSTSDPASSMETYTHAKFTNGGTVSPSAGGVQAVDFGVDIRLPFDPGPDPVTGTATFNLVTGKGSWYDCWGTEVKDGSNITLNFAPITVNNPDGSVYEVQPLVRKCDAILGIYTDNCGALSSTGIIEVSDRGASCRGNVDTNLDWLGNGKYFQVILQVTLQQFPTQ